MLLLFDIEVGCAVVDHMTPLKRGASFLLWQFKFKHWLLPLLSSLIFDWIGRQRLWLMILNLTLTPWTLTCLFYVDKPFQLHFSQLNTCYSLQESRLLFNIALELKKRVAADAEQQVIVAGATSLISQVTLALCSIAYERLKVATNNNQPLQSGFHKIDLL